MNDTPKDGAAGSCAPTLPKDALIMCVDAAEARLMRRVGYKHCITSVKMRRMLSGILSGGAENAVQVAVEAVGRLGGVSTADSPEDWPMWKWLKSASEKLIPAFSAIPPFPTLLRDPDDVTETPPRHPWLCQGTTVLIAEDTVELVRVALTYAGSKCYRHKGRMDEPFRPRPGGVCLVTKDELRLLRLSESDEITVVFTYDPQEMSGGVVAPWPSSIRALCGEKPSLAVGISTCLLADKRECPFFIGLVRGVVGRRTFRDDPLTDEGALEMAIETNRMPKQTTREELVWEGGDDLRHLVRFGGVTIFMGNNKRRKVQLRSLGLVRAGTLAGAPVYNLADNHNTLWAWVATRKFAKKSAIERIRERRRVRPSRRTPEGAGGYIKRRDTSPQTLRRRSKEASKLRNIEVWEVGASLPVHLGFLREGGTYFLNGRACREKGGAPAVYQIRCKIRCPRWETADTAGMLAWLAKDPHVVAAGFEPSGRVFAVVKVANGTEDQQTAAVSEWCESAGLLFLHRAGACSFVVTSVDGVAEVTIGALHHTNWHAESLQTRQYERYQTQGDYGKPLKLTHNGAATLLERARAYADKVPLDVETMRNTNLHGAAWNIGDKFGAAALAEIAPVLLARSTLPEKEKRTIVNRALTQAERKRRNDRHPEIS